MFMLVLVPAENGFVVNVTPRFAELACESVMEPEKLPVTALSIVVDPWLPALIETELGEADMVNPAGAGPVRAVISAACGLPHPVTRSKPVTAE